MIDNYDLYRMHEAEEERRIARLPRCNHCGEPITGEKAYDIDGLWCEKCTEEFLDENTVWMEDYLE